MPNTSDQAPANSIAVLDLHLDYLRRDVARLVEAVGNMATRDDIKRLEGQMAQYVTRDELTKLEKRLESESFPTRFDKVTKGVTQLGSALAVLAAGSFLVAKLLGKM